MPINLLAPLYYSRAKKFYSDRWYIDTITCPEGKKQSNFQNYMVNVAINDLRGQENFASLDTTGFQTLTATSSVHPSMFLLGNDDQIVSTYYPEVKNILQKVTGADKIVIFDHTFRRNNAAGTENPLLNTEPVLRVHVDQTPKSAHDRISYHVEEKYGHFKRFQIINLWRPIANIVYDYPLAMADFRSIDVGQDLVPIELRYPSWLKDKETYGVKYNSMHKWYYWSHMNPEEVLLIKCYDSASLKLAQLKNNCVVVNEDSLKDVADLAPHTSFFNESDAALNIRRQSIEVRAIVLHM